MVRKPPFELSDYRLAKLDDEFETVAKPRQHRDTVSGQGAGSSDTPVQAQEWTRGSERKRAKRAVAPTELDESASLNEQGDANANKRVRPGLSLKARAVGYLSRREHARNELARKLQAYSDDPDEINAVLDALEKEGWLSTERFAHSLVHRRAAKQGTARIVQELRQHGVDDLHVAQLRETLKETEFDRAREVWRKRFSEKPQDRAGYAKQARFLASRGFAHDLIHKLLGDAEHDDS